jgi:hypothetical protein
MKLAFGRIAMTLAAVSVVGGGALAAAAAMQRVVMPAFVIDVRTPETGDKAPRLMLIYGERGNDPFREGAMERGQRISGCRTIGSLCISEPARKEFGIAGDREQSLQVRLFNGNGNPVIGGVSWYGPLHPSKVRVVCDLRIRDTRTSCAVAGWDA